MPAKRIDPLQAKAAKQKKIAIGGAILLLALLAYQGPKTLKMLGGPQAVAAPTSTAPATAMPTGTAAPSGTASVGAPAAPAPELSAVADSDLSPEAEQGQLATFERFASKDPFAQQAEPVQAAPPRTSAPKDGTEKDPVDTKNAASGEPTDSAVEEEATDGGFTTGGSTDEPELAAATSISVNGVAQDVAIEAAFPKDEPTFVLVEVAKSGKAVEIGIAGGEYANGGETITLALGRKITLQNTADGSRYELELHSIQGQPVTKKK